MASTINALTSGGGVALTGDTSGQLQLQTNNGTTAVTINTSQQVGIGTNNPQNLLHAVSSITLNTDSTYPIAAGDSGSIGKRMVMGYFPTGSSANNGFGVIQSVYTGVQWSPTVMNPNGGNVLIGTSTNNTSGGVLQVSNGITFPATQSASSDANTLDDYEEGTWTPTDASGAGLSFTVNSATYTKIGRVVYATCYVTYPTTANTSQASIGNLPFASANTSNLYIPGVLSTNAAVTAYVRIPPSSSTMPFSTISGATNVTNAQMSNNYAIISITYPTST